MASKTAQKCIIYFIVFLSTFLYSYAYRQYRSLVEDGVALPYLVPLARLIYPVVINPGFQRLLSITPYLLVAAEIVCLVGLSVTGRLNLEKHKGVGTRLFLGVLMIQYLHHLRDQICKVWEGVRGRGMLADWDAWVEILGFVGFQVAVRIWAWRAKKEDKAQEEKSLEEGIAADEGKEVENGKSRCTRKD